MSPSITFRVSRVPLGVSNEQFMKATSSEFSKYTTGDEPLKCIKLLILPDPTDAGKTQVAIQTWNQGLPLLFKNESTEETVSLSFDCNDPPVSVEVDRHFYGLTCLHNGNGKDVVDLIFLTGLAGHAYGSWKVSGRAEMWVGDFLPEEDFKDNIRVLMYGYDSKLVQSDSTAGISDYATNLLQAIAWIRLRNSNRNRIIFFGHSLGGLVIKQAICDADFMTATQPWYEEYQNIVQSTSAAFFFGVPNKGIRVKEFMPIVKHQPNKHLIGDICEGSDRLRALQQNFGKCAREKLAGFQIVTIRETAVSRMLQEVDGEWQKTGKRRIMVKKDSAESNIEGVKEHKYSRAADHSGIAKFKTRSDQDYRQLMDHIREFIWGAENVKRGPSKPALASGDIESALQDFQAPYPGNPGYTNKALVLYTAPVRKRQFLDLTDSQLNENPPNFTDPPDPELADRRKRRRMDWNSVLPTKRNSL